ncbi:DUF815 domain containing protein [Laribacter hongkongensis HLHK9]|uniref:DUF815 domain containing protein n=1 Tax=Laribacter hongkongensis (strain HLHK9) TaxID=557598 RepID=C1DCV2_LARHH|nr:ATP-binding protein [Laribacter hongkongensis]ACO73587.1 DUF815 domain containing protein [Laribacter hongkongensis HLHK9]
MTDPALLQRFDALLDRLDRLLPPPLPPTDWNAPAFRWQRQNGRGVLRAVSAPHTVRLDELTHVERQKTRLLRNTAAFVAGRPANNVLLTGARGSGKSSLVKALLPAFMADGLRLVEVDRQHLADLADIVEPLSLRPERFILFCDDLSFEEGDDAYKALKSALDGGLAQRADNVLIYATSNRRHLLPDRMADNLATQRIDDEIHPGEAVEEKVSLSERFGLWLSFYPFDQDAYLAAVGVWLQHFGLEPDPEAEAAALLWARLRGARSGRIAWQFACDWAGRMPEERTALSL